jgi:hypothetical protein
MMQSRRIEPKRRFVSFRFVSFRFALTALGNAEDASFYTALEAKVTAAFTGKSNRRERKKKKKNARFLKAVSYDETYVHDETRSFAKTGSGQASGKVREKGCLFRVCTQRPTTTPRVVRNTPLFCATSIYL